MMIYFFLNIILLNLLYFEKSLDDCVYRYFVCTERSGKWPYNKDKCTLLFKRCCEYIENGNHHLDTIHIRPVRPQGNTHNLL